MSEEEKYFLNRHFLDDEFQQIYHYIILILLKVSLREIHHCEKRSSTFLKHLFLLHLNILKIKLKQFISQNFYKIITIRITKILDQVIP